MLVELTVYATYTVETLAIFRAGPKNSIVRVKSVNISDGNYTTLPLLLRETNR